MREKDWHRIHAITNETRSVVVARNWHPPAISNIRVDQMTERELQYQLDVFKGYQYF